MSNIRRRYRRRVYLNRMRRVIRNNNNKNNNKMNFLIVEINTLHHKNKIGLELVLKYLKIPYKFGSIKDIPYYSVIYSPGHPINTSLYPNKKFIFGPHFSIFPNKKLNKINNIYKNSIYIQPSNWVLELWRTLKANEKIPLKSISFPVEVTKFKEIKPIKNRDKVFIYFKHRNPLDLEFVEKFLQSRNLIYKIFNYGKRYDENTYLQYLQDCKYGIIVDAHESQGFALEEALSCNIPLLVWNISSMSQEYKAGYKDFPATTIPYWDHRCGEFFYNKEALSKTFDVFIQKLDTYKPREYILDNISTKPCSKRWLSLIKK